MKKPRKYTTAVEYHAGTYFAQSEIREIWICADCGSHVAHTHLQAHGFFHATIRTMSKYGHWHGEI